MTDFAFLQLQDGDFFCGRGPFIDSAEPPLEGQPAFYANDFALSDPKPWKTPAEWRVCSNPCDFIDELRVDDWPEIAWSGLNDSLFREVYREILQDISQGELDKSVPVLSERGILHRGSPGVLVQALMAAPKELYAYGYQRDHKGMIGVTPEHLLRASDGVLETMALAGTAPRHEADQLLQDPKELREHGYVVDYLMDLLAPHGEVRKGARQLLDLGSIVHLHTPIRLVLKDRSMTLDEMIRLLHPTPALGACPRGDGALRQLMDYRERLVVPDNFGAPFGCFYQGAFEIVVAIRQLSWDGRDVSIPSGVGLVEGSRFDREWRELALKRNSVKSLLGV